MISLVFLNSQRKNYEDLPGGIAIGLACTTMGYSYCLLSLAYNHPVIENLPITGENPFTGEVLQIGRLKEKIVARKEKALEQ